MVIKMRIEHDQLGSLSLEDSVRYGIHTARAVENFKISQASTNMQLIYALVMVKKAAAIANERVGILATQKAKAIEDACDKILAGEYDDQFVTHPLQGGAGTSTNMNVNEVIANIAGNGVSPLDDVNRSQSTNDVYPTALRIAAIYQLRKLSQAMAALQEALQAKEDEFAEILKLGRTQLMDALPVTLGQSFLAYAQAISRDRWRLYKVEERLRQTNLGGTAVGTGLNAKREYIFEVTHVLQEITGLGLARADFLMDVTQNNDVFVEVSGLIKSAAVNLIKISSDLRLMNSGPVGGFGEIVLPPVQAGSSIMPGKINPVMPEMMTQVGIKVMANDMAITTAAAYGQLELNAFLPMISDALLDSLELMTNGVGLFQKRCIEHIKPNKERCLQHVEESSALAAALVHHIGYERACEIALLAKDKKTTVKQVAIETGILTQDEAEHIFDCFQVTSPGIPGGEK